MNTPAIVWTKWRMLNELASIGGWRVERETEGAWREQKIRNLPAIFS